MRFYNIIMLENRIDAYIKTLWDDPNFVKKYLEKGFSLRYASERLKRDKNFAIQALKINPDCFFYLSENLKKDAEILEITILAHLNNHSATRIEDLKDIAPSLLKNQKFCIGFIQGMDSMLAHTFFLSVEKYWNDNHFLFPDDIEPDTAIMIIKKHIPYYKYMPNSCKENIKVINTIKDILKYDVTLIEYVDSDLLAKEDFLTLEFALQIVKENPSLLRYLPNWYKGNEEILDQVMKSMPSFNHIKINFLLDAYYSLSRSVAKTLALEILEKTRINFSLLPDWCKGDKDIAKKGLEKNPESIKDIDPKLLEEKEGILTPEIAEEIVKINESFLLYLPHWCDKDKGILDVIRMFSDKWTERILSGEWKSSTITDEKTINRFFQVCADDIVLTKKLALIFQRLPDEFKRLPDNFKQDDEFINASFKKSLFILKYMDSVLLKDKKIFDCVLNYVKENGLLLEELPNLYKGDMDGNMDIPKAALEQNPKAVRYIDPVLLNNNAFLTFDRALTIVKADGELLRYLPAWYKGDMVIAKAALEQNPKAVRYIDPVLLNNNALNNNNANNAFLTFELALTIVKADWELLRVLPDWCKKDRDIAKAALDQNLESIKDIDPILLEDEEGILTPEIAEEIVKSNKRDLLPYLPDRCADIKKILEVLKETCHAPQEPMQILDTTKQIKIWITRNPNEPLGGPQNELRLIRERQDYPYSERKLTLISDKNKLSPEGFKKLEKFCNRHKINLIFLEDIEKKLIENNLQDSIDWKLFSIAKAEINDTNGSLAAASDILRLIAFTINLGTIYTDVDSIFHCKMKILAVSDLLLNIIPKGLNNDLYAFPGNPNSNRLFVKLKETIYENYLAKIGNEPISSYFEKRKGNIKEEVIDTSGPGAVLDVLRWYIKQHYYDEDKLGISTWGKMPTITHPQYTILGGNAKNVSFVSGTDKSWLQVGIENINEINKNMQNAANVITKAGLGFLARKKEKHVEVGKEGKSPNLSHK